MPQLTTTIYSYLDPQPEDRILDIGCGDGQLTSRIADSAKEVLGLDASPSMIQSARNAGALSNCAFRVQDCATLLVDAPSDVLDGSWDKVFSNAALHWILRAPETRSTVYKAIHAALRPDGVFVFEQGGAGNVAECHAAVVAALIAHGMPVEQARAASPWFFASESWARQHLEHAGFAVEKLETEYRPTKLTPKTADGKGGLEGWIRLMCAEFLAKLDTESEREEVLKWTTHVLEDIVTHEDDGSQWIGYVRLRGIARKRAQ